MALSYGFCLGENESYTSSAFAKVFRAAFGDGVCAYGGKFQVRATDTMSVSLSTGFAKVGGWWIKSDESTLLTVSPADNRFDRYDAVVLRASLVDRAVRPVVVRGQAAAFPLTYAPLRNNSTYEIVLCNLLVRMGVSSILDADIADTRSSPALCGMIMPLSAVSNDVIHIYDFLRSSIDNEVARLIGISSDIIADGEQTVRAINAAMQAVNVTKTVGEIEMLHGEPTPAGEWLLCDGSTIDPSYTTLSSLLNGILPDIQCADPRFRAWIYAADPRE